MPHLVQSRSVAPTRTFRSAKTAHAVPIPHDLVEVALIQASLDPDILAIAPVRHPVWSPDADHRCHFVLTRVDVREGIVVTPEDGAASLEPEPGCLPVTTLRSAVLSAEPYASNVRLVWACATRWFPGGDQVRILDFLGEYGESPMREVARVAQASSDPFATVMALACRDLVELDLHSGPLGPETRVARRLAP